MSLVGDWSFCWGCFLFSFWECNRQFCDVNDGLYTYGFSFLGLPCWNCLYIDDIFFMTGRLLLRPHWKDFVCSLYIRCSIVCSTQWNLWTWKVTWFKQQQKQWVLFLQLFSELLTNQSAVQILPYWFVELLVPASPQKSTKFTVIYSTLS